MECLGNMIHACAIKSTGDAKKYVPYFGCMAEKAAESIEKSSFDCAALHEIPIDAVKKCVNSVEGNNLMSLGGTLKQFFVGKYEKNVGKRILF